MTRSWHYWCLCLPWVPSLLPLCYLPFSWKNGPRTMHQLTQKGLQTLPGLPPGELEDMCRMCSTGRVPAHPGKFIRRQGCGCGEGKAPVWVYNWDDTPIGCIINKQKRGCWMTWCLKRGRGFSGFMSGHRARRVNQVPPPPLERPQSKNVQLCPNPWIKDTALESLWVTGPGPLGWLTPPPHKNSVRSPTLLPLFEFHLKLWIPNFGEWMHENFLPRFLAVSWALATVPVFELEA